MTREEIIAKALEHANQLELKTELLRDPDVREAAVVYFQTPTPGARVEITIDTQTGAHLHAMWPDIDIMRNP